MGTESKETLIVDSDIVIDAIRGVKEAVRVIETCQVRCSLSLSAVTWMEVVAGCRNAAELRTTKDFMAQFGLIEVNEAISWSGRALMERYRLSHGLALADALIAATALTLPCPLASKNQRDYRFIDGLILLAYP